MSLLFAVPASGAVVVLVEGAGVSAPTLAGYNFVRDTLNGNVNGGANLAFGSSGVTGTVSSGWINSYDANVYGGVGGTGKYGSVTGNTTINLSTSVNYFGLWGSALDGNNTVALYNNDTLLGSWALQSVLQDRRPSPALIMAIPSMAGIRGRPMPSSTLRATRPSTRFS